MGSCNSLGARESAGAAQMQDHPADTPARDPLTGLLTAESAEIVLARWQASGSGNAQAMLIALGELGALNTAFGRQVGDGVLKETARRIALFADDEFAGCTALLARIGGSGFLLAVQEDSSRERWQWLAEALSDALALPFHDGGGAASIRLWPRVVLARAGAQEAPSALLDKLADGLAQPRAAGTARVLWVGGEHGSFGAGRRQLQTDLLSAIDRGQIDLAFQPQFGAADGRLVGAEALARWNHPEAGLLGAATLFTLAERIDHVAQLSRYVIARALMDAARWPGDLRLSVNVTATDLSADSFAAELVQLAAAADFPLGRLTLEITEQSLLGDLAGTRKILTALSAQGVQIALDDFGAGFCNFSYLKLLPLDIIKLDRAMVDGITDDPRDLAVFRGIVAMARALELAVVVEGVEHEAQREIVAAEGCAYFQGFLAAPPLSRKAFEDLAANGA